MIGKSITYLYAHKFSPKAGPNQDLFKKDISDGTLVRAVKGESEVEEGEDLYFVYFGSKSNGSPKGFFIEDLTLNNEKIEYDFTEIDNNNITDLDLEPNDYRRLGQWKKSEEKFLKDWNKNKVKFLQPEQPEEEVMQENKSPIDVALNNIIVEDDFPYDSAQDMMKFIDGLCNMNEGHYVNTLHLIKDSDPESFKALSLLVHHLYIKSITPKKSTKPFDTNNSRFNTGYNLGCAFNNLNEYVRKNDSGIKDFDLIFESCVNVLKEVY